MASSEIDDYIQALDEPRRSALTRLRQQISTVIPDAEEGLSYGAPVFRLDGKAIAGFAAAARHLSYLPHSGTVLGTLGADRLTGFAASKGALKVPIDVPLPDELVRTLVELRRAEAGV